MEGMSEAVKTQASPKKKGAKGLVVLVIVALIIAAVGGFLYYQYYNSDAQKTAREQKEVENVIKGVSKIMMLPSTTSPAIVRIDDPATLASQQAFFSTAEQGDYLILFLDVAKAVIYSQKNNIISNFGVIQNQPAAAGEAVGTDEVPAIEEEEAPEAETAQ
jgi:hypothetical protein